MITIVKHDYNGRIDMYFKGSTKNQLIGYLSARDKYKNIIKNTPWYLIYNNYNKFKKYHLAELLAERDIYEFPDSCK